MTNQLPGHQPQRPVDVPDVPPEVLPRVSGASCLATIDPEAAALIAISTAIITDFGAKPDLAAYTAGWNWMRRLAKAGLDGNTKQVNELVARRYARGGV